MCGRYALYASEEEIRSHFQLCKGFSMRPRYNIAPSQTVVVVCEWGNQVEFSRWGFIPSWAKSEEEKLPTGYLNARSETLKEKPTFKTAFKKQRCLVLASGYFEWRSFGGKKQPYYIYLKDQPLFAFAGLFSRWRFGKEDVHTCTIITTAAPPLLQKIHERMPVVLTPEKYRLWLSSKSEATTLEALLVNPLPENFNYHPVSTRMSSPLFEGIESIQSL